MTWLAGDFAMTMIEQLSHTAAHCAVRLLLASDRRRQLLADETAKISASPFFRATGRRTAYGVRPSTPFAACRQTETIAEAEIAINGSTL